MEGYLFKKGRGESKIFGRKNWKKRWCILEGQYLTYYEDFDLEKKIPINKKVFFFHIIEFLLFILTLTFLFLPFVCL